MLTIYLSTTGVDTNDGVTPATSILTLARAQDIIIASSPDDVEIRIDQGTYTAPQTNWTTYVEGHTISFMPIDWAGGGIGTIAGLPIFDGDGHDGWWLKANLPDGDTGLRFYYLGVQHYGEGGLIIHGSYEVVNGYRIPEGIGANSNVVYGCQFKYLGSLYADGDMGFAAVDLVNSSFNSIRNNWLVNLENKVPSGRAIHGVYMAHGSSYNLVENNQFHIISGNPVRTRNRSGFNKIRNNTFIQTGGAGDAHYMEWFDEFDLPTGLEFECASEANEFRDNTLGLNYAGGAMSVFKLTPPGVTYSGQVGCPVINKRLYTSGNA